MLEMRYPADIREDPEGKDFVVTFPDLEGAITGAATLDEALDEAADCLASWLAFALADHKPIPEPSVPKASEYTISVPLWIAPKIALYKAMTEQNISNSELARRLGVTENVVRRMLDPDHATKSTRLEAALKAVGRHLYLVYAA
jgi:antitoxin HicB